MSSCLSDELCAGGDADLLEHEVDAGDGLGHRMLDLQARVHLDEVELAVLVEELDRAGAAVLDLAHGLGDRLADLLARSSVERGRGGFLQDLLVAPLQRAVALAEVDGVALAVAEAPGSRCGAAWSDTSRCRRASLPKAALASARAVESASPRSAGVWATFMPRPPPPAVALISTGKPMALAIFIASGSLVDRAVGARHDGNAEASLRSPSPRSCRP